MIAARSYSSNHGEGSYSHRITESFAYSYRTRCGIALTRVIFTNEVDCPRCLNPKPDPRKEGATQ